jgi:hypothetical protein
MDQQTKLQPMDLIKSINGINPRFPNESPGHSVIVSVGIKFSSKSYTALAAIYKWLQEGKFDSYHIVSPSISIEQNGSYDWLLDYDDTKNPRTGKKIVVNLYDSFSKKFKGLVDQDVDQKKRHMIFIDDATAMSNIFLDEWLLNVIVTARHRLCTLWIAVHALSGILNPRVRANTDVLLVHRTSNKSLREKMYRELLGEYFETFKQFEREYVSLQHTYRFPVLAIDLRPLYGAPVWLNETNNPVTLGFKMPSVESKQSDEDQDNPYETNSGEAMSVEQPLVGSKQTEIEYGDFTQELARRLRSRGRF